MSTDPATEEKPYVPIKGEGDVEIVKRRRVRIHCGTCGEDATRRHTYLLENFRSNPRSSAYRSDDCTWCSDHEEFTCDTCNPPILAGYSGGGRAGGRFSIGERFAHLFLKWKEEPADDLVTALRAAEASVSRAADVDAYGDYDVVLKTIRDALEKATGAKP